MKKYISQILVLMLLAFFTSCSTANLFESKRNQTGSIQELVAEGNGYQYRIKPDDKISLSIWNHDNLSIGSVFGIYNSNEVYGKWVLVDSAGLVRFPKVGKIHLAGKTITEAQKQLENVYAEYVVDPIIVVKVLNREMTVLGEVKDAGTFLLEEEKNTLAEILGKAGGLNFYANPKKVKLIRKTGIISREFMLDLSKINEYDLHSIIVKSGDIIYVPTQGGKSLDKKAPTIIPFASLLTSIGIAVSLLK